MPPIFAYFLEFSSDFKFSAFYYFFYYAAYAAN